MKRALFAGSFDPPTFGHLDIIRRAARVCDELIVGIAINIAKSEIFSQSEREKMLREQTRDLKNVKIESFSGLTVEFAKRKKIDCLIRGVRPGIDTNEDFQLALANQKLSGIDTLFLLADPRFSHISSTLIKEIASFDGSLKEFVSPSIEKLLIKRLSR